MIFVSERDVIDKRLDFYENDIYYDFSSSINDNVNYIIYFLLFIIIVVFT
jgi:hypothetical protein